MWEYFNIYVSVGNSSSDCILSAASTPIATVSTTTSSTSPNLDIILQKFQKLSYYDQHYVTNQCTAAVTEQMRVFTAGNSSYIPLVEHISFLFDLMQSALNLSGLMDFIMQVCVSICILVHSIIDYTPWEYSDLISMDWWTAQYMSVRIFVLLIETLCYKLKKY